MRLNQSLLHEKRNGVYVIRLKPIGTSSMFIFKSSSTVIGSEKVHVSLITVLGSQLYWCHISKPLCTEKLSNECRAIGCLTYVASCLTYVASCLTYVASCLTYVAAVLVLGVDVGVDYGNAVEEALCLVLGHVDGAQHVFVRVLHRALLRRHPQHWQTTQLLA